MNSTIKKILIGIDGSIHSMNAVCYVADTFPEKTTEVTLFNTMKEIDSAFFDMSIQNISRERLVAIESWKIQQKAELKKFMGDARDLLLTRGFEHKNIHIKIQPRKVGIARDIVNEAKNDYQGVVIGRKGVNKLKDLVLGSIAVKLTQKLGHRPIWVVGEKVNTGKILVGMDSSENAMKAVDYLCSMLSGKSYEVTLVNVARGIHLFLSESYSLSTPNYINLLKEFEQHIQPVLDTARKRLIDAGFDPLLVNTKIVTEADSRAGAIVNEAKKGGFGTIVVGRRGISKVEEFFMGRVSNKIINTAKDVSVCIVG